jgi:hypothetical protein
VSTKELAILVKLMGFYGSSLRSNENNIQDIDRKSVRWPEQILMNFPRVDGSSLIEDG